MTDRLYVVAASAHAYTAIEPPRDIKQLLLEVSGSRPRRTNRVTDLALMGAWSCTGGEIDAKVKTGLYLGSGHGSPIDTSDILNQILVQNVEPMPLTFINVSSNMPGYYVAQQLGITGHNQAVSAGTASFESAAGLAQLDLLSGAVDQALVGVVEECAYPLSEYRPHITTDNTAELSENSSWMMLSRSATDTPLTELRLCRHFADFDIAATELVKLPTATQYVIEGELPSRLLDVMEERKMEPLAGEAPGYNMSIAAWRLIQAIEKHEHDSLLYLRGNPEDGVFVMWLQG